MNGQKAFLLLLVGSLSILAGLMLRPFLGYLLGALILAFILSPFQNRLSTYVGERISAGILIVLAFFLVSVPFVLIFGAVAEDAQEIIGGVNQTQLADFERAEDIIREHTGQKVDLDAELQNILQEFVSTTIGNISRIINLVAELAIGFSVMLFALYYLLKDGKRFSSYLKDMMPLPNEVVDKIHEKTYRTTHAVIKGHILVAILQGLIAGIGLWLTGIPNFAFWTFVMILLAFIPIVGAFLVWGPAAIYLLTVNPMAGIALFIYGTIVVSLTDNFLRPLLVERGADLHPAVILIGVIGGVYVFGAPGLFIGPVVFGVLKSVLEVFKNNYSTL